MPDNNKFDTEKTIRKGLALDYVIVTGDKEAKAQAWRDKLSLLAELDREAERIAELRSRVAKNPGPQLVMQF